MTLYIIACIFILLAGMADGLNQVLQWRYLNFKKKFPGINDRYWSPELSWYNKYKNRDPKQGARFFGSTTFFVWHTDGYHLTRFLQNFFLVMGIMFISRFDIQNWWLPVIVGMSFWVLFRIGFNCIWKLF